MKAWRGEVLTVLATILLFSGVTVLILLGVTWYGWCLYVFVRDYEECQTQLRRMAMEDDNVC